MTGIFINRFFTVTLFILKSVNMRETCTWAYRLKIKLWPNTLFTLLGAMGHIFTFFLLHRPFSGVYAELVATYYDFCHSSALRQ